MSGPEDAADDYMASQDPPAGSEVETILPLSRTRVEMRGETYYAGSVVRRLFALIQEHADEIRSHAQALHDGTRWGSIGREGMIPLLDMAEQAERIGREAMDGIDGEEHTGGEA